MLSLKIREARLEANISVVDMAKKLDIKRQQLHRFEAGTSTLSIEQLCKISEITGKRVSWFFGEENIDDRLPSTKADIARLEELLVEIRNAVKKGKEGEGDS